MLNENLAELMPAIFKSRKQRFLVATLLGVLLYTTLFFINLGFNFSYSVGAFIETCFCILFFFNELELILILDRRFNLYFGEQRHQLRRYLSEYSLFLVLSLLILTAVFIIPVLLSMRIWSFAHLTDYLRLQMRQVYGLVVVIVSLLYLIKSAYINYLNLKQMEIDAERLQKERVQQQFETLKNYINPDFLYSSLDTLTALVLNDKDKAAQYIHKLSGVYRYILENKDKELVTLRREAEFMQAYAFLLQMQYGSALKLTWEFGESSRDWCLPPLTIQFIVENLMQHFKPTVDNSLYLNFLGDENQLLITYCMQQSRTIQAPFKNSLIKIMQKYEYLTDRKIITRSQGAEQLVSMPLLKVTHQPRTPISIPNS